MENPGEAHSAWAAVGATWRLAVTQAWESWTEGSAGVGAVLLDEDGGIVAIGRNRLGEHSSSHLSGTVMAHAEMDVLSQVPFGTRVTGPLYTTFEPCLMCAATIALYRVPEIHYAAADPLFDGLVDWFATYPFTAERQPRRVILGGPIGTFCHVLHLVWLMAQPRQQHVIDAHRRLTLAALACAEEIAERHRLRRLADDGAPVVDAITELWPDLVTLAT